MVMPVELDRLQISQSLCFSYIFPYRPTLTFPPVLLTGLCEACRIPAFCPSPLINSLRTGSCSLIENIDNSLSVGNHYIPSLQISLSLPQELLLKESEGT